MGFQPQSWVGLWHWAANIRLLIYLCVFETTSGILREFPKLFRNIFQTALSNIWGESFRTSWSANVSMWHFGPVLLTVWYAFLGFADSGLRRPSTNKTIPNRFPVVWWSCNNILHIFQTRIPHVSPCFIGGSIEKLDPANQASCSAPWAMFTGGVQFSPMQVKVEGWKLPPKQKRTPEISSTAEAKIKLGAMI